jgi:surface protein
MGYMFANCNALQSLDLSHWKTDNVNEIVCMFDNCNSLLSLDVSGWNTSNVTNMYGVFNCCFSLQSLDVSNWNTSNVSNMSCMFSSCNTLQSLNVSNWITSSVTDMSNMFAYCNNLQSLDVSNWNTNNVTNMYGMFSWCDKLEEINISHFDMTNVGSCDDIFGYCNRLHTLRLDNCNYDTISKIINSSNFPTGEATNAEGYPLNAPRQIYVQEANAAGLTAPDGWEFVYVESSEGGEPGTGGMPGIGGGDEPEGPTITPDPEPSEPSDTYVISFSTIGSKQLTVNNVDVTNQVVETGIGVDGTISCKYETTEVIRQASFKDNTDLVRVFSLDSSNILDMSEMFDGCTSFVGIIGTIDTSSVLNMSYMFRNCTSLSSIPDSYFTSMANVMDMTGMYYNCSSMTGTVEAYKYWENSMTGSYSNCFYNCTALDNYSEIPASWGGPSDSE